MIIGPLNLSPINFHIYISLKLKAIFEIIVLALILRSQDWEIGFCFSDINMASYPANDLRKIYVFFVMFD